MVSTNHIDIGYLMPLLKSDYNHRHSPRQCGTQYSLCGTQYTPDCCPGLECSNVEGQYKDI